MRFYFEYPKWVTEQSEEIFAPLMTVLFSLAMDEKSATEEEISKILAGLDETEENVKAITELIMKHKDDIGEVVWVKEGQG